MNNRYVKRCSTSLIRKMQIKTTVGYNLTPVRMVVIKNKQTNKQQMITSDGKDIEKLEHLYPVGGR